jgi:arsenite-transporting ATPase
LAAPAEKPRFLSSANLRLILFGGKGGVGKTTCAAAAAIAIARRNPKRSVLLVSTDPAHSLEDSLDAHREEKSGGPFALQDPGNLTILEIRIEQYLLDFKAKHGGKLQEIARRGTFLDDQDIDRFLDLSMPGLDELLAFLEICRWTESGGAYDCIVVDTAPTGHSLRLLAMPEFIRRWLETLNALLGKHRYMKRLFAGAYRPDELDEFLDELGDSVDAMEELLKDGGRCRFVPVMIAEQMSVRETVNLLEELVRLEIHAEEIVVNRLYPDNECPMCSAGREHQMMELSRLPERFSSHALWGVPLYPREVRGLETLEAFWKGAEVLPVQKPPRKRGKQHEEPPWRVSRTGFKETKANVSASTGELTWDESGTGSELQGGAGTRLVERAARLPSAQTELLLFAGKGGVGKTTLACATALRMAREFPGKEILLFSTDPAHSLADCLNVAVGRKPTRIISGLTALEINAQAEFDALKKQYAKELAGFLGSLSENFDLAFDREVMERMMDLSPPGLDEIMALTVAMDYLARGSYHVFILDSAPTGHLLRLLELPGTVDQWLKAFFELFLKYKRIFRVPGIADRLVKMSKDLKRLRSLLIDSNRSALYAVAILTEMALEETRDLVAGCERMRVDVPLMFLNMATPANDCELCSRLHAREMQVAEEYGRLFPDKHRTVVYRQPEPRGIERLNALGEALYGPKSNE